jgi:NADH:ubiquinone oxidoreductase subunit H
MISVFNLSEVLIVLVPVLMTIAFVTIAERKVMAAMQRRCGPNAVGTWGVLQPFSDALKLLVKEIIRPRHSNSMLFVLGPCITLIFALLGWAIIPFGEGLAIFDFELGVFFALAVSSLGGYGILISGWSANSKYAFLGAIRATAQLLSYELVFSSIVLILILFSGSFSLTYIVECQQAVWNIFPLMPIALAFFIAILAETNRPPFDLAEAESELVAGLCELWLNFFLSTPWVLTGYLIIYIPLKGYGYFISKLINQVTNGHLFLYWAFLKNGWCTISWVLGLIQYRNNNLNSTIGILSDLYCILIKYGDKIINPFNGNFSYTNRYYNLINSDPYLLGDRGLNKNNKLYTWTSKIKDPSERYTPCEEIVPIGNYIKVKNNCFLTVLKRYKNFFLYYKSKPGNPIFDNLSLYAKYNKWEITEKNKTKSRSNKWKYIISEKSRKHIILGCEGKTYFEKLKNFYNSWWNYYVIRKCNTGEILYEYHSPIEDKIKITHSRFKPPYEEFPSKIKEFINYSDEFQNYYLENIIAIINDNMIDKYTELNLYFNNLLRVKRYTNDPSAMHMDRVNDAHYLKLNYLRNNESEYIESNIEQYYSFCNNKNIYIGWVSIIKINNFSAQPTYYNNLIKRYHKEWINMLKYWVDVPNDNLKWNSNTKMNDINLLAITTNEQSLLSAIKRETVQYYNYNQNMENKDNKAYISEPFIPSKYKHKFNYLKITIKNIKKNKDLYNKYTKSKKKNKLPWGIKELIIDDLEKKSKEFVKIWPKFK